MPENPIITQLTPEQETLIPIYIDKWKKIALSTQRLDRQKAYDAVAAAYHWFDTEAPEIIFVDSPYEAFKELDNYSQEYLDFSLLSDLRHPLLSYEQKIDNSTAIEQIKFIEQELFELVLDIRAKIYPLLEECLYEDNISLPDDYCDGSPNIDFLIPECCFYDFCISVLNCEYNENKWQVFKDVIQYCGWLISYKNICFICERPTRLSFDSQNRLHAEGEVAIEYADGFKVYAYQDVTLPKKYGEVPAK